MMREGWTYKKLGEVADIKSGYTPSSEELLDNGALPYFKVGDMNVEGNEKYLNHTSSFLDTSFKSYPQNSIVFPKNGAAIATNKKRILSKPSVVDLNTAVLISKTNTIFTEFLYYWICKVDFKNITRRGTIPTLDIKTLMQFVVPIPPLSEQERIVSELDLLSGIIEKKKAQLKEYDKLAQSIFYDMFAQYEDKTATSNFIVSLKGGKSLAGDEECKNKVLKTGAVTHDYFKCDEVKNLPKDYIPLPENLLKDGDLLISRMNTLEYVGAVAYVWKAPNNTYIPDRLWRAQINKTVNPIFLWFSLKQPKAKEQIRSLSSGTSGSMKNISIPRFLSVLVKNPPLPLQQSFASKIEAIERQKALIQQTITETETLFNSRMDYYFD